MTNNPNSLFINNYGERDLCLTKGQGAYVQDSDGKKYLDFSGGVAVSSLGHCHPVLVAALKKQSDQLWHSSNLWHNSAALELARQLTKRTFADRVFLCNSGLEANEAALKLARKRGNEISPKKNRIVCFSGAFHGRSIFTLSLGGKEEHRAPYEPLPGGIIRVEFNNPQSLQEAMDDEVCAVIVEPIQGEGGVNPATTELLKTARDLCDRHKALLIFDEVQSGVGRSGYLYSYLRHQVQPDLLTTAKGLGSGFPVGALLATEDAARHFGKGNHGSTFGGNALAAVVAAEVLKIVDDEEFLTQVRARGEQLHAELNALNQRRNCFTAIRGEGLLWGAQMQHASQASQVLLSCREQGLLILLAGAGDVLRFAPPLIISEDDVTLAAELLDRALQAVLST